MNTDTATINGLLDGISVIEKDNQSQQPFTSEDKICNNQEPNPNYKNAPVNILYGNGTSFLDIKEVSPEEYVDTVIEFIKLRREKKELQEMFDMQVKLVTALELENEELRNIIEALTKGKLPCNPDHNGECLICDNLTCDCPLTKK